MGADNFVLLAPRLHGAADIGRFCAKLMDALHHPVTINSLVLPVNVSVGCASFPDHGLDAPALFTSASLALRLAQSRGGNQYASFQGSDPAPVQKDSQS